MSDRSIGPEIEGLTFIEHLGTGGYSDVYLYEQRRPRMRVAVKVLQDGRLSDGELAQFAAEAETMAELADHPNIVQVFSTSTTRDGRPYLVMKYYPPPNLARRAATQRLTIAEVLRTGIQISSAVETAHRAGILHRDIKPANILISQYGEPGLADFGIAGKTTESTGEEDLGVSIPWSPPEVLSGASNGSVASDIYSLAATLWHLLAGRSPHEVPGGDNSPRALMGRILRSAPPATGRADAPASLDRLLQQSMSKNPQLRPASALEFARLLQGIEQELRYARTPIVVEDSGSAGTAATERAAPTVAATPPSAPAARANPSARPDPTDEPATTQRPVRVSTPQSPPSPVVPPLADRPPTRPADTPPKAERASRFASHADPTSAAGSHGSSTEGTRVRPTVPVEQLGSLSTGRVPDDPPPTTRRPARASSEPVPAPPRPRRASRLTLLAAAAAACVVAVIVAAVLLSGGSRGGNGSGGGETPSGPVGSNQAGFGSTTVAAPKVSAAYDSAAGVVKFSWLPASSASQQFVYALNGGALVGPTATTSVSVRTASPSGICIVVGAVGSDGTRHLAPPVCG